MSNFNDCVYKGEVGELIIDNDLPKRGYVFYKPLQKGSHPIDRLCIYKSKVSAVEIKTKPRRNYYEDTGLDEADWIVYKEINEKIKVYIFFVDELLKKIYWQSVDKLSEVNCEQDGKKYPV